jgi:Ca-activated chloride channel family protein
MPEGFHFLHPLWFLALVPMALLLWLVRRHGDTDNAWRQACDAHLLPHLLSGAARGIDSLPVWLLAAAWLLAVTALADPVWNKRPQPVYRSQQALVVVLDLSRSMSATDLKPSRLERARYKVDDILRQSREGQTGLVVFAGDAFAVSPLTSDTKTIRALLDPLNPDLMPVQGSRADLGLEKAAELFRQSGVPHGNILLITDGFENERAIDVARRLYSAGYRTSVLGVGTPEGAPVPDGQGGYLRNARGAILMPGLKADRLQRLAGAGGGSYSTITTDNSDLRRLLPSDVPTLQTQLKQTGLKSELWQSEGPWVVLGLLPLAALAFRRGWLLVVPLVVMTVLYSAPRPAMAGTWDDLWARRDQQADAALRAGDLQRAQSLARQPLRRGTAAYRAGDYDKALQAFAESGTPQGDYNRGNALAKLGRYQDAVAAYDQALKSDPDMQDAAYNKAQVEKLLRQQQRNKSAASGTGGKQQSAGKGSRQTGDQGDKAGKQKNASGSSRSGSGKGAQQPQAGTGGAPQGGDKHTNGGNATPNAQSASSQQSPQSGAGGDKATAKPGQDSNEPSPTPEAAGHKQSGSEQQAAGETSANRDRQPGRKAEGSGGAGTPAAQQSAREGGQSGDLDPRTREQRQADERWLRRIPDDPGGLLRRKFLYQYSQRERSPQSGDAQNW